MKQIFEKRAEFDKCFKLKTAEKPQNVSWKEADLSHNLMKEENEEYLEACMNNDLVEIADALGDQLYVWVGNVMKHGLQHKILDVFDEIHRSNMSKLDENGEPIINGENGVNDPKKPKGKVLKSKGYFKPNIAKILDL